MSFQEPSVQSLRDYASRIDARTLDFILAGLAAAVQDGPRRAEGDERAGAYDPFRSRTAPPLSVVAYGRRLLKYNYCPPMGIALGVVLLARYCRATNTLPTRYTIHRLLLTAVVVALKCHFDIFYSNQYYAQVGGIANSELNRLELAFLAAIHFSATATVKELAYIADALGRAGSRLSLDDALHVVPADSLPDERSAAQLQTIASATRALAELAVPPQPFAGSTPPRPAAASAAPPAASTVTVTFVDDVEPSASTNATPHADRHSATTAWVSAHARNGNHSPASTAPPRSHSAASGLDSDYVAGLSHGTSRRPSAAAQM